MLDGDMVRLRARLTADVDVLHTELYDDVTTRSRADSRPWQPVGADATNSPYAVPALAPGEAVFSVVERSSDDLAGAALLWGIDLHNRLAHIGIALRPAFRGRRLSLDVVRVLCRYGFVVRGLHRLQIETLADNAAMIRSAQRAGFVLEGNLRKNAWVMGAFVDEVVLGLLADDWAESAD